MIFTVHILCMTRACNVKQSRVLHEHDDGAPGTDDYRIWLYDDLGFYDYDTALPGPELCSVRGTS